MLSVDHLLMLVEPFRERQIAVGRKMSVSHLSTLLFNDGKRLRRMIDRKGDIGSRKLVEAFQWFSDHWPEGAEWPERVPRPDPCPTSCSSAPPERAAA